MMLSMPMKKVQYVLICVVMASGEFLTTTFAQSNPPAASPVETQVVPVIDGGVGPCSLELTVTTGDGKAAGAATVKVHIAYGFGGLRRLDLEAGTNSDGKVKFTGLPARVRRPPLEFHASKGELTGTVQYDPATECQGKSDAKLEKQIASPGQ
jgi:hypothetical protein